jgi:hypothetical protein
VETPRAEALLFPYLPVIERVEVGPFELIPHGHFEDADAQYPWVAEAVRGLFDLYKVRTTSLGHGVVVRPREGRVGEAVERAMMTPLRRVLVAAVLDGNPRVTEEDRQPGHSVATSDNALLYGHGLSPDGWVAVQYGLMVEMTVAGLRIGEEHSEIHAPAELHLPLLGGFVDEDYLAALWPVLTAETDEARRVSRAVDWLDLSWRNTTSITEEMRIMTLKAAFEVLFDSDKVDELRERLSALLDEAGVQRRTQTWTSRAGNPQSAELTELEWWFTQFSFLRNAIAHGNEVADADFDYEGQRHIWIAEARLRGAIKHTVAQQAGEPDILVDRMERAVRRAIREAEAHWPESGATTGDHD